MNKRPLTHSLVKQQGAALIVALMLLIILTMLGISAIDSTKLETQMAANLIEYNQAFQVSEIGVREPSTYVAELDTIETQGYLTVSKTFVRDDKRQYQLDYTTSRIPGEHTDATGKYGANTAKIADYVIESIGRSEKDNDEAVNVELRGGMSRPTPAAKGTLTTSEE